MGPASPDGDGASRVGKHLVGWNKARSGPLGWKNCLCMSHHFLLLLIGAWFSAFALMHAESLNGFDISNASVRPPKLSLAARPATASSSSPTLGSKSDVESP